jgi:hypothetical protein
LVRTKKLRKVKIQLLPESGDVWSPLPDFGKHVWPDPAKMAASGRTPPDLVRSGRIPAILARSGRISCRIRLDLGGSKPFLPDPSTSSQIPVSFS